MIIFPTVVNSDARSAASQNSEEKLMLLSDLCEWNLFVMEIMPDRAIWFGYSIPVYSRRVAIWFRWAFRIVFSRCSMSLRGIFDMERLRDVFLYKSSRTICSASGLSWRSWSKRTPWSAMVMAICACISCFLERTKESAMFVFLRCSQLTRSFSTYSRKYVNTRDSRSVNRFTAVETKCSKGSTSYEGIPHRAEASLCPWTSNHNWPIDCSGSPRFIPMHAEIKSAPACSLRSRASTPMSRQSFPACRLITWRGEEQSRVHCRMRQTAVPWLLYSYPC